MDTINEINSIVSNDLMPITEKLFQIGTILSYVLMDNSELQDKYYEYYENLIWSRIPLIETFDYDNCDCYQNFLNKEGYNWE